MQAAMPGASPMPGQGQPPAPQGQAPAGTQQGQYDLPTLVQVIRAKNPNITGPQLMSAVNSLMPVLNLQGQQQYRQAMLQLGQMRAQTGQQHADTDSERANTSAHIQGQRLEEAKQKLQLARQKRDDANLKFKQNHDDTQAYREKVLADRAYEDATKVVQVLGNAVSGSVPAEQAAPLADQAIQTMRQPPTSYAVPPQIKPSAAAPPTAGPSPQDIQATIANAKAAIASGRDPAVIRAKLQQNGIDPKLLDQ